MLSILNLNLADKSEVLLSGEGSGGLECVTKFCYLGDMIGAGGGCRGCLANKG